MAKKYQEVPSNFKAFEDYIICKKDEVVSTFTEAYKCLFYDTCSILHHSNSTNRQAIINYLKGESDTIIVTRTVLMELTANSLELHPVQIQYFKELFESGFKIILFDEELILYCLKEVLSISTEDANKLLGYAVKEISKSKSKTYQIIESMDKLISNKLKGSNPGNKELFSSFFQYARTLKSEGDSIAEELILICIIVLTKIPFGKYVLISDDMRIRSQVISVNGYVLRHHERKEPYQLTTASLIYKMYKKSVLVSKAEMLEIMQSAFKGKVNVFFIGEYDIKEEYQSFDCEDLIDRLIKEKDFKIIY